MNRARALSSSSQGFVEAGLKSAGGASMAGRKSMSAGAGSRRGIAHSSRVLGVDKDAQEAFALSQLTSGKVDVSFEGSLGSQAPFSPSKSKGKGKAKAHEGEEDALATPLFDVDLESGQPTAAGSSHSSRAGRLLKIGAQSMPWKKTKTTSVPAYQSSSGLDGLTTSILTPDARDDSLEFERPRHAVTEDKPDYSTGGALQDDYNDRLAAFDDDQEQLLYAAADDSERPGYFAPGDRSFGYNSLHGSGGMGGYGGAVGFEAVTWTEGGWMMLSSVLVGILMTVAILISVDVIDWPGDGIGKN